jgi:hypothetical protein
MGRVTGTVVLLVLALLPSVTGAARGKMRRVTRCCLTLDLAGVPPGPVCAQVRGRHGIGPRLACRLLGGRPLGRGDCNPAVCVAEPA